MVDNVEINNIVSFSPDGSIHAAKFVGDGIYWQKNSNGIYYNGGNVGIGTTTIPNGFVTAINGKIITEGFYVEYFDNWPDYVFNTTYKLLNLNDLSLY